MNRRNFAMSPMPDVSFAVMETSKNTIRSAFQKLEQTEYDGFKETCEAIYNRVNKTFELATQSKIAVRIQLTQTANTLENYNKLIKAAQPESEQIKRLRQDGDNKLNSARDEINLKSEELEREASNIKFLNFENLVDEVKKLNKQLEETINPNIEKYEAKKAQAEQDYADISAAMKVFEDRNLFEFISETIPTPEELSKILKVGMESPELAAVIAGLEVYKKLTHEIGEGFSYVQMKKARDYTYEQIQTYTRELETLNQRKGKIEIKLKDLENISIIESERFTFTEQVKNLATTYDYFIQDINSTLAAMGVYENYDNMLELLNEMVAHIDNL
ncbi:alpha-xenorhabdolysin family binary toxin subunit B [Nostoc sp. CCY 9925]|uniref:alpha-xenorhabdolysin family binary toxin subunit B n=1 Tax=Nostoc sp. CCY 9925 TaxID=3103865 RepID=UPI0039C67EB4